MEGRGLSKKKANLGNEEVFFLFFLTKSSRVQLECCNLVLYLVNASNFLALPVQNLANKNIDGHHIVSN